MIKNNTNRQGDFKGLNDTMHVAHLALCQAQKYSIIAGCVMLFYYNL